MRQIFTGMKETSGTMTETHSISLTLLAILLITILTATNVQALEVTEFESNPEGSDSGNEWIELYSGTEIDLSEYTIENGDGDQLNLKDKFTGFFVITLDKQWLDNSDEKIIIKKSDTIIDQTPELSDSKNSRLTLTKCDDSWMLQEPTKSKGTDCKDEEKEDEKEPELKTSTIQSNQVEDIVAEIPALQQPITQEKITLQASPEEPEQTTFVSKEAKIRLWILYSFIGLCILIIITLAWNKL